MRRNVKFSCIPLCKLRGYHGSDSTYGYRPETGTGLSGLSPNHPPVFTDYHDARSLCDAVLIALKRCANEKFKCTPFFFHSFIAERRFSGIPSAPKAPEEQGRDASWFSSSNTSCAVRYPGHLRGRLLIRSTLRGQRQWFRMCWIHHSRNSTTNAHAVSLLHQ